MQTKFKRHQSVRILVDPDPEFIEYHEDDEGIINEVPIKKGMKGRINILLSNGKYHVEIFNEKGILIAYAPFNEEDLEEI